MMPMMLRAMMSGSTPMSSRRGMAPIAEFDPEWVDMHSIVIIGSSTTRMLPTGVGGQGMVTPRDYKWLEER